MSAPLPLRDPKSNQKRLRCFFATIVINFVCHSVGFLFASHPKELRAISELGTIPRESRFACNTQKLLSFHVLTTYTFTRPHRCSLGTSLRNAICISAHARAGGVFACCRTALIHLYLATGANWFRADLSLIYDPSSGATAARMPQSIAPYFTPIKCIMPAQIQPCQMHLHCFLKPCSCI